MDIPCKFIKIEERNNSWNCGLNNNEYCDCSKCPDYKESKVIKWIKVDEI